MEIRAVALVHIARALGIATPPARHRLVVVHLRKHEVISSAAVSAHAVRERADPWAETDEDFLAQVERPLLRIELRPARPLDRVAHDVGSELDPDGRGGPRNIPQP